MCIFCLLSSIKTHSHFPKCPAQCYYQYELPIDLFLTDVPKLDKIYDLPFEWKKFDDTIFKKEKQNVIITESFVKMFTKLCEQACSIPSSDRQQREWTAQQDREVALAMASDNNQ